MCYCTVLPCFILNLRAISKYKPPRVYIRRVDLTEGFLRYKFRGLIHGGAYIFQRPFLSGLFLEGLILQSEGLI